MGTRRQGSREGRVDWMAARVGGGAPRRSALALIALLCCTLLLAGLALAVPLAHAAKPADGGTLTIVVPAPDGNNVTQGPVGTNVSVSATSLSGGDSYQLGYAQQSIGCDSGFTAIASTGPLPASDNGNLSATVAWPSDANAVGASYNLCLSDTTTTSNPVVSSTQVFRVEASSAPTIAVTAATPPGSTGTATATTTTNGATTVQAGAQVTISGQNFLPDNTPLAAYLTLSGTPSLGELKQGKLSGCASFNSQNGGSVNTTCTLPTTNTGPWYLIVASTGGPAKFPPALESAAPLNIVPAPNATATPSVTATPSPSPKASATPKGGTGGGHVSSGPTSNEVAGIIGLSALAIILFVAGVLLLASTLTTPRRHNA